jgi:cyclopropane fatty-acyl-phospholipid synthase-like methyltransferase
MLRRFPPPKGCRVLDIGSGAGHWIDFYLNYYDPAEVCGLEIAPSAVEFLQKKYEDRRHVHVSAGDVTQDALPLGGRFDVINAIGVLFHIVEDAKWEVALRNLANFLTDDGVLLVGGEFGMLTENTQFHTTDEFESWDQFHASAAPRSRVNKRLRSLRMWQTAAERSGLVVRDLQLTKRQREVWTPQNNVLLLSRPRPTD